MARKLGENLRNDLKIWDPVSDSAIIFCYRMPTAEERIQYERDCYELVEGKVKQNFTKARQKWGPEILTGLQEGCLLKKAPKNPPSQGEGEGGGGALWAPFSSDPSSPQYDPEWKSLTQKYASDLVEILAAHVFEGARAFSSQEETPEKN